MLNLIEQPIKTIHDKRLAYLVSLADIYRKEGYQVKVNGHDNILEIYRAMSVQSDIEENLLVDRWG